MTYPANHPQPLNGNEADLFWMQQALNYANQAAVAEEVPVGAIVVLDDKIIGAAHNYSIAHSDPTAHAEILALREAAKKVNNYRLLHTKLYVTLEPCLMCAGAMIHARVQHLFFGAYDPKAGVTTSHLSVFDQEFLNHQVQYQGGILQTECSQVLTNFFKLRR